MKPSAHLRRILILVVAAGAIAVLSAQSARARPHNVIIFVADGLRAGSVNAIDSPTLWAVRNDGVNFSNSHSVFPSLTMPNAAAIATGHYPGDTGQFANNLFAGFPPFDTGNFGRSAGSLTPSTENDAILADLDDHFGGRYLGAPSLLELARQAGFSTAALGKTGPTALQDVAELNPSSKQFKEPGHDHPGRRHGHRWWSTGERGSGGVAQGRRPAAVGARAHSGGRQLHDARHPQRQRGASAVVRGRDHEGDSAEIPRAREALSPGVLVRRSRSDAARAGRQPEPARPGCERTHVKGGDTQRGQQPEADPRLCERQSRICATPPIFL